MFSHFAQNGSLLYVYRLFPTDELSKLHLRTCVRRILIVYTVRLTTVSIINAAGRMSKGLYI